MEQLDWLEGGPKNGAKSSSKVVYHAYLREINGDDSLSDVDQENDKEDGCCRTKINEFFGSWSIAAGNKMTEEVYWLRRLIWALIVFGAIGYCAYLTYKIVEEYRQFPKSVSIELVELRQMEFPAVTFCSLNPLVEIFANFSDDEVWSLFELLEERNFTEECGSLEKNSFLYDDSPFYGSPDGTKSNSDEDLLFDDINDDIFDGDGQLTESSDVLIYEDGNGNDDQLVGVNDTDDSIGDIADALPTDTVGDVVSTVEDVVKDAIDSVGDVGDSLAGDTVENVADSVGDIVDSLPIDAIGDSVDSIGNAADSLAGDAVEDVVDSVGNVVDSLPTDAVGESIDAVGDAVDSLAGDTVETVADSIGNVVDSLPTDAVGESIDAVGDVVDSLPVDTVENVADSVGNVVDSLPTDAVGDSIDAVGDAVDSLPVDTVENVADSAGNVVDSLPTDAVGESIDAVGDAVDSLPVDTVDNVADSVGNVVDSLPTDAVGDVADSVSDAVDSLPIDAVGNVADSIGDALDSLPTDEELPDLGLGILSLRRRRSIAMENLKRRKREASQDHTRKEIAEKRFHCSVTYQRLYFENLSDLPNTTGLSYGDTSLCEVSNFSEKYKYDPICNAPYIQDIFGNYSEKLLECNPYQIIKNDMVFSNCCRAAATYSMPSSAWVPHYSMPLKTYKKVQSDSSSANYDQIVNMIVNSHTTDGSDFVGQFVPAEENLEEFSSKDEDFIATCSFDQTPCTYRDFRVWNSDQYGKCYTINSNYLTRTYTIGKNTFKMKDSIRKTYSAGPNNGLRLTFNLHTPKILSMLSPQLGLRVMVHDPKELPFPEDEGVNVIPGVMQSIRISARQILRTTPPVGECKEIPPNGEFDYSSMMCRKICLERTFREKCNCSRGLSPAYNTLNDGNTYQRCSTLDVKTKFCLDAARYEYKAGRLNCDCPVKCKIPLTYLWESVRIYFQESHSYISYPKEMKTCPKNFSFREWRYSTSVSASSQNLKFFQILQNIKRINVGDDICTGFENSTARVHLYLDYLGYEKITESASYTWDTLLSNIGGSLGLFCGMCFVSILEFLEFLLSSLFCCRKKQQPKPKKRKSVYLVIPPDNQELHPQESQQIEVKPSPGIIEPTKSLLRPTLSHKNKREIEQAFKKIYMSD